MTKDEIRARQFNEFVWSFSGSTPIKMLKGDYDYELKMYSNDKFDRFQRMARLSAAIKNYKTKVMLLFVFENVPIEIQLSPKLTKKICEAWFDRGSSFNELQKIFGGYLESGSGRIDKATLKAVDTLLEKHKEKAAKYFDKALRDAEKVKSKYADAVAKKQEKKN